VITGWWMRTLRRLSGTEEGNAIVEFVYLAVLLMVPLVYVLLAVFRVQAAAYAVSGASREAGRVFVGTESNDDARRHAFTAASLVMADSNLSLRQDQLAITCSADPCLTPGSTVDVTIDYAVPLPFLPPFLADVAPASIRVSGQHLEVVDRFRRAR